MGEKDKRIGFLKMVTIEAYGMEKPGGSCQEDSKRTISFVFGVGSTGLSPFEMSLSGKAVGEEVVAELGKANVREYLGHCLLWFLPDVSVLDFPYLGVRVKEVRDADNREVIRAMAEIAEFGHDCSCCS